MPATPNEIYLIGEIASGVIDRLDRIATAQETANRIALLRLQQGIAASGRIMDPQLAREIQGIRQALDN